MAELPTVADAAGLLRGARMARTVRTRFSQPDIAPDLHWAYAVQRQDLLQRLLDGEVQVGAKLGFTGLAKQRSLGIDTPVFGFLTDVMRRVGVVRVADFVQPRIEPELVFRLRARLDRAIVVEELADFVDALAVGLEVIDSRYEGYRFGVDDVVADAASAAAFTVGEWMPLGALNFDRAAGAIAADGEQRHVAPLTSILGDARLAVVRISEHLQQQGWTLDAGALVLGGAFTEAIPLEAGRAYEASIDGLPAVQLLAQ